MAGVLKELLELLEERLVEHDESRKDVQAKLLEVCFKITKGADSLEEKISGEISEDFEKKRRRNLQPNREAQRRRKRYESSCKEGQ